MTKPEDACRYLCERTKKEQLLDQTLVHMMTTTHALATVLQETGRKYYFGFDRQSFDELPI
jgi:hypothetical protein